MRRLLALLRPLLSVVTIIATIVLGVIVTYRNYQGEVNQAASLALAATVLLLYLLMWPAARATGPANGTSAGRTVGRAIMWTSHLVRAGLAGYGVYYLTTDLTIAFLPTLAVLAVVGYANGLVGRWGRHLAGLPVGWRFVRGAALLRYLLRVAIGVAVAGYSRVLSHYWWAFVDAVPLTVYRWLRDALGTAWLAVPAAALGCLALLFAVAVVATVVHKVTAQLLGPRNAVSRWLAEHGAMTWIRAPEGTVFDGGLLVPFRFASSYPNEPGRRTVERCRAFRRPLSTEEADELLDQIVEAALRVGPDRPYLLLTYRAAGDHEEVGLAAGETAYDLWDEELGDPDSDQPARDDEQVLTDFPAVAALRRLRASTYVAGRGAPFTLRVTIERPRDEEGTVWREWNTEWTVGGAPRPGWRQPPRPNQYAADLRRFPAARRMVPLWLREELGWRWLLPLRVPAGPRPAD